MAMIVTAKNATLPDWKRTALQAAVDAAEAAAKSVPNHPPALLPITVAQFLLESNWGQSGMGDAHNYFGIKAKPGQPSVERQTTEFVNGQPVTVTQSFRAYASLAECFEDHARLICERQTSSGKKIYENALKHPNDPQSFADALTGVYATDPKYGAKLKSIMESRGLLETFGFIAAV